MKAKCALLSNIVWIYNVNTWLEPISLHQGTKGDFRLTDINREYAANKTIMNRGLCWSIDLHRISFVRASRDTKRGIFFDRLQRKETVLFWAYQLDGVSFYSSPPSLAVPLCAAPSRPVGGIFGFLDSAGWNQLHIEYVLWNKKHTI